MFKKPTRQQRKYIAELQAKSMYPLPAFLGTTRDEATNYIEKYRAMAYMNQWATTSGYGC